MKSYECLPDNIYIDSELNIRRNFLLIKWKLCLLQEREIIFVKIDPLHFLDIDHFRVILDDIKAISRESTDFDKKYLIIPCSNYVLVTTWYWWYTRGTSQRMAGSLGDDGIHTFSRDQLIAMTMPYDLTRTHRLINVKLFGNIENESLHFLTFFGSDKSQILKFIAKVQEIIEHQSPGVKIGAFVESDCLLQEYHQSESEYLKPNSDDETLEYKEYVDLKTKEYMDFDQTKLGETLVLTAASCLYS